MPDTFESQVAAFDRTQGLALLNNAVDAEAGTIKGVSLATAGVEAIGHGEYDDEGNLIREFWTDTTTLETMLEACESIGQPLKAKLEHGTGLAEIVGEFDNYRIDGNHLRADFTAYPTSDHKDHLFTLAKRLSKQFGVSVTALLQKATRGGVDLMRCMKIESVDFVDCPAINAGLFSRKTALKGVSQKPLHNMEEKEVKALLEAGLKPIQEQLSALSELMPKAPSKEELAADETAKADAEKAEMKRNAAITELKECVKKLSTQNTELAEKVKTATELGVKVGAKLQSEDPKHVDEGDTFESEMAKGLAAGEPRHVTFNKLMANKPQLAQLEAKKQGKQAWQLL